MRNEPFLIHHVCPYSALMQLASSESHGKAVTRVCIRAIMKKINCAVVTKVIDHGALMEWIAHYGKSSQDLQGISERAIGYCAK